MYIDDFQDSFWVLNGRMLHAVKEGNNGAFGDGNDEMEDIIF